MSARYAVYLAPPPDSALWRFGSRVVGRDAASGEIVEGFAPPGHSETSWRELTAEPRRYGFHATLKAPFRLRDGRTQAELEAAIDGLAASFGAFDAGALGVAALALGGGGFVALRPLDAPPPLAELEARAVRELDAFRAPLSESELQRRRPERLTERQREHLTAWGYPYVLDEFRPHFTLTGHTPAPEALAAPLAQAFADAVASALFRVEELVLFVQDNGADFQVRQRFRLRLGQG